MKKFVSVFFILYIATSYSQCAMCKAVMESGDNAKTAEAVNSGITYLMVFPYILVAILTYFIIRHRRKLKEEKSSK